jgi:hypothetical protein
MILGAHCQGIAAALLVLQIAMTWTSRRSVLRALLFHMCSGFKDMERLKKVL